MDRGCPNCGYTKYVNLKSYFELVPTKVKPKHFSPRICLNCGMIYVCLADLNSITLNLERAEDFE